ncbi:hypothetical protein E5288_WYG011005 [Bos mutus]|uniref:Uncharacterized protein n=1 Tax=Bos mutus TaxID=72004 RepID=A0A6B0R3A6_9CETA|nr:hypothetical protein [Bos mutus]
MKKIKKRDVVQSSCHRVRTSGASPPWDDMLCFLHSRDSAAAFAEPSHVTVALHEVHSSMGKQHISGAFSAPIHWIGKTTSRYLSFMQRAWVHSPAKHGVHSSLFSRKERGLSPRGFCVLQPRFLRFIC